jgi:WD40 repeat protein
VQEEAYKYWAFVSYSHRDQAWAEWLHRALETYRVPRRLVGRESAVGPLPRRLFPVFRDQEELPSSPSLSSAIDQALQQSRYLIVIASPYAAVSKWVDQEIARFRALGRGDRILCLIVDGEPHAHLQPGKGLLECFPPELRVDGFEPIGADLRHGRDGKPAAKLKLIAGILGVGLDELRRRELRRRRVQRLGLSAASLVSALVLYGLWQMQQHDKRDALTQQALKAHIESVYQSGRAELLAHNQARAAAYLAEAYRLGVDTPALRFMLARAMRIVEAPKLAFQTGAPVTSVRLSPDSRLVMTRSAERRVFVWDTASGQKRFEIHIPQSGGVVGPGFSRDSRILLARSVAEGGTEGAISLWSAEDGHLLSSLKTRSSTDHTFNALGLGDSRIASVAPGGAAEIVELGSGKVLQRIPGRFTVAGYSRDGKRVLTGAENGEVTMWDADGGHVLRRFGGLADRIISLDDSEDGTLLAASSRDGAVRAWRTADGALRLIAGHPTPNPRLIFNIDGSRLLTWADDGMRVWNTANGALVYARQSAGSNGVRVDITSSGRWVLLSSASRLVMQDAASGNELFTLDGHRGIATARDISDDDRTLATGGPDGRVVLWRMPDQTDHEFKHAVDPLPWAASNDSPGMAALFSHSGSIIATGAGDGSIKLWDMATRQLLRSITADAAGINALDFSRDDSRLLSGGFRDGLRIWDVASGESLLRIDCQETPVLLARFSSDARYIAAAMRGGSTRIWDAGSGSEVASFDRDDPRGVAFSPDGRSLAIGIGGTVKLWDLGNRAFVWTAPQKPIGMIGALEFSGDGTEVLVSDGRSVDLLSAADGKMLGHIAEPSVARINSVRFDHAGKRAVMSDYSGNAMLWTLADGTTTVLRGHVGEVRNAVFSPDDNFVLTSGADATAKLWDARSGELLDTIAVHASPMPEVPLEAAAFSPDGRWILTGSVDGSVHLDKLELESRSAGAVARILACRIPWQSDADGLLAATPRDADCRDGSPPQ